ncbi:MAG: LacI family transcriptional regulator [Alicyclobacillus sp.]|nr:LacI family transcriptional regulator [Alicyclobacillus sp.]
MNDVAKRAGVSRATAARVLGGYAGPRSASRDKVLAAAKELGYVPNKMARALASQRSSHIGVIIPDIENVFFARVYRGIERVCQAAGYTLVLGITGEDAKVEETLFRDMLAEQVEGIIVAPTNGLADIPIPDRVPVVSVDRIPNNPDAVSWVTTDNFQSAREAASHLISQKYRNIAVVANTPHLSTVKQRLQGIRDSVKEYDARISEFIASTHQLERTVSEVKAFLFHERPGAVIATDSVLCMATLLAARDIGIQISQDMGLVAYDDEPWMPLVQPPITAIHQPAVELGVRAAQMLMNHIRRTAQPQHQIVRSRLVVRSSSLPAMRV